MDVFCDDALGILQINGGVRAESFVLDTAMKTLDFSVGLGVVRGGFNMGHLAEVNELAEVLAGVLGAVVADDSGLLIWVGFTCFLDGDLGVGFRHAGLEVPAEDSPARPI